MGIFVLLLLLLIIIIIIIIIILREHYKCPLFSSLLFLKITNDSIYLHNIILIPNRFPLNLPAKVAPSHMSLVHPMSQIRPVCLDLSHSKGACWSRIRASLFAMTGWQLLGFGMAFLVVSIGKC